MLGPVQHGDAGRRRRRTATAASRTGSRSSRRPTIRGSGSSTSRTRRRWCPSATARDRGAPAVRSPSASSAGPPTSSGGRCTTRSTSRSGSSKPTGAGRRPRPGRASRACARFRTSPNSVAALAQARTEAASSRPASRPAPKPGTPGVLFNGMIAPLVPYSIRGAIWYQGESNRARAARVPDALPGHDRRLAAGLRPGRLPVLLRPDRSVRLQGSPCTLDGVARGAARDARGAEHRDGRDDRHRQPDATSIRTTSRRSGAGSRSGRSRRPTGGRTSSAPARSTAR